MTKEKKQRRMRQDILDDVQLAMASLEYAGEKPTVRRIREIVGQGSMGTILKYRDYLLRSRLEALRSEHGESVLSPLSASLAIQKLREERNKKKKGSLEVNDLEKLFEGLENVETSKELDTKYQDEVEQELKAIEKERNDRVFLEALNGARSVVFS